MLVVACISDSPPISIAGARVGTGRAAWSINLRYQIFDPQIHVGYGFTGSKSNDFRQREKSFVILRELNDIRQPEANMPALLWPKPRNLSRS